MDERAALDALADRLPTAGDDCAVVDGLVLTTDMLHASTDFPAGTTSYTAGWRAVGASLSDVASMGAEATAAVAVYGAPTFDEQDLLAFVDGAADVCERVDAEYVGGDLDSTDELTIASTALGRTDDPVLRSGAEVGDAVCVTGTLGRSAAAFRRFEGGDVETANDLFTSSSRRGRGRRAPGTRDGDDGLQRRAGPPAPPVSPRPPAAGLPSNRLPHRSERRRSRGRRGRAPRTGRVLRRGLRTGVYDTGDCCRART